MVEGCARRRRDRRDRFARPRDGRDRPLMADLRGRGVGRGEPRSSRATPRGGSAPPSCRCSTSRSHGEGHLTREALQEVGGLLDITHRRGRGRRELLHDVPAASDGRAPRQRVHEPVVPAPRREGGLRQPPREAAGVDAGQEVSEDGLFSVHEEECLGVCEFAPAVQIDFANHDTVSPERMRELIADAARRPARPSPPAALRWRASGTLRACWRVSKARPT